MRYKRLTLSRISPKIELEFRNVDFYGGRKTGGPRVRLSWQGREPTNNSTRDLELSHKVQ
jgi:hypothetical protein